MNFQKLLGDPRIRRNLMLGALALLGFAIAILIYFLFLQPQRGCLPPPPIHCAPLSLCPNTPKFRFT